VVGKNDGACGWDFTSLLKTAIESVKSKKEAADRKFKELKPTDKKAPHWHSVKAEVDKYVGDVDENLREALTYF
jgi:hypothetical protein